MTQLLFLSFQIRIELCKFKDVGGWCCGAGSVTIDWTVERSGFVPGEEILVNGAIQNESREAVATSKVALNMVSAAAGVRKHVRARTRCCHLIRGITMICDARSDPDVLDNLP